MGSESGSIIPFGIAAICLSLVISLLFAELTGVEIQTFKNKQLSDLLTLKVAADLRKDEIAPLVGLEYAPALTEITATASKHLGITPANVSVFTSDGKTIEGKVCTAWKSITGLTFGSFGIVCSSSKARAAT